MKVFRNAPGVFCALLALAGSALSLPSGLDKPASPVLLNMTAEEFARVGEAPLHTEDKRNWNPCRYTKLAGDGKPHQNFVITQKAGTLVACSAESDNTGTGHSTTLGWSMSGGVSYEFLSFAFSVEKSETYSTQNAFSCQGVAEEEGSICVLFYQAVTAYTVNVFEGTLIDVDDHLCAYGAHDRFIGQEIVYAPNSNGVGSAPARGISVPQHGVNQCFGDEDRDVHFYCGPAGDASWWEGKGYGPWVDDYMNALDPQGCEIPIEARHYTD